MITPTQLRTAMAVLDWTFSRLAAETKLTRQTLRLLSKGKGGIPQQGTHQKLIKVFEENGVELLEEGARRSQKNIEVLDGPDCYIDFLDIAMLTLLKEKHKELLKMFASDSVSPAEVNDRYRLMRRNGVKMRQLIAQGDNYLLGELEEYRMIPAHQFTNIVSLIYGNCVAQVNGIGSAVTIFHDAKLAEQKRMDFEYRWNNGTRPEISTATERF